jgi:hypothetical protein
VLSKRIEVNPSFVGTSTDGDKAPQPIIAGVEVFDAFRQRPACCLFRALLGCLLRAADAFVVGEDISRTCQDDVMELQ